MKIQGVEIPRVVIDACITRMKSATFQAADIASVAIQQMPRKSLDRESMSMRVAAALIQKYRKLDRLSLKYPVWTWIP